MPKTQYLNLVGPSFEVIENQDMETAQSHELQAIFEPVARAQASSIAIQPDRQAGFANLSATWALSAAMKAVICSKSAKAASE